MALISLRLAINANFLPGLLTPPSFLPQDMPDVPSLHALCCSLIAGEILNLDNVLDILAFAQMHQV